MATCCLLLIWVLEFQKSLSHILHFSSQKREDASFRRDVFQDVLQAKGNAYICVQVPSQCTYTVRALVEVLKFNVEEVQKIVRDNIELCLGGNTYSHSRTQQWITLITDKTLARLNKLNKPFKYILRITLTQKNGAALHSAAAYYWDVVTDGTCTVRWENKFMYCIVNVWGLALQL